MSLVKRNVIANMIGGVLLMLLTVVITPLQINILGLIEYHVVSRRGENARATRQSAA